MSKGLERLAAVTGIGMVSEAVFRPVCDRDGLSKALRRLKHAFSKVLVHSAVAVGSVRPASSAKLSRQVSQAQTVSSRKIVLSLGAGEDDMVWFHASNLFPHGDV